jgi:putative transposase
MMKHRPMMGRVKTVTVLLTDSGEWYACITVENRPSIIMKNPIVAHNPVGVDSGLTNYLYLSDGSHVDNPKFIKNHRQRIVKAQRRLSRKRRVEKVFMTPSGEHRTARVPYKNCLRARQVLASRWQDYDNAKNDWQWKLAGELVKKYDLIAYEDLTVQNMMRNHNLAGAIQDAAWSSFWMKVEHKAAVAADRVTQKVPPRYTTQRCNECGHLQIVALSERTYRCPNCGYVANRDHNASTNILELGVELSGIRTVIVGMGVPEFTPVETGPILSEAARPMMEASLVAEAGNKFYTRGRTPPDSGRDNAYGSPEASALGERHRIYEEPPVRQV